MKGKVKVDLEELDAMREELRELKIKYEGVDPEKYRYLEEEMKRYKETNITESELGEVLTILVQAVRAGRTIDSCRSELAAIGLSVRMTSGMLNNYDKDKFKIIRLPKG